VKQSWVAATCAHRQRSVRVGVLGAAAFCIATDLSTSYIQHPHTDDIPEVVYDSARAKRGALNPLPPAKDRITIRLDKDILDWFKGRVREQGGGNYQTLINDALREYIQGHGPLDAILRRVIREELRQTGHFRWIAGPSLCTALAWTRSSDSSVAALAAFMVRPMVHPGPPAP
jgi:uncharacterized protein (DUF4415 family)